MEQHNLAGPPRGALASVNNHAIRQGGPQTHWVPNDSELDQLRHFLAERPDDGGPPLELLQPDDPELGPKAKKLMERDGYVIVVDALSSQELQQMRQATHCAIKKILADERTAGGKNGNRGGFRFSFGSAFLMGLIEPPASLGWHVLVDPPAVTTALCAIFDSDDYRCTGLAGDFCMPGCNQYQQMHDDMGGAAREYDRCPSVVVNYPMVDFTKMNGPMRVIPGTMQAGPNGEQKYVPLEEEPVDMLRSTLVGCPAGAAILRDPRIWHGGTPNVSNTIRAIPNALFQAPWFEGIVGPSHRKNGKQTLVPQMPPEVYAKLSEHGMKIAKGIVKQSVAAL